MTQVRGSAGSPYVRCYSRHAALTGGGRLSGPDLLLGMDADPARRNVVGLIAEYPEVARAGIRLRQLGPDEGLSRQAGHGLEDALWRIAALPRSPHQAAHYAPSPGRARRLGNRSDDLPQVRFALNESDRRSLADGYRHTRVFAKRS